MCIGNELNGDDGVGPYIAKKFPRSKGFKVLNCETAPESFVHFARGAKKVVIVDAVDMGLDAGEIRRVPADRLGGIHFSSHALPLPLLISYMERFVDGKITLIGIQPKRLSGEMSREVKLAGEKVIDAILNNKIEDIEVLK